jgi:cytochrome c oxidase cbb3-type subunit I
MSDYQYDNQTVRGFIISSIFWGVVGILIGLWISVQMWKPELNFPPFFTFGRLRVVHTNGLAFGLGIGAIFGISYYIVMRLTKRPLLFPKLARFHLQCSDNTGGTESVCRYEPVSGIRGAGMAS